MSKVYLVTGANVGLGKETVRQLAVLPDTRKVYLACRSFDKATLAMKDLQENQGISKDRMEYIQFDASGSQAEIAKAVESLNDKEVELLLLLDGIVMNAGGWGQDTSTKPTRPNGVLEMVQINLLGHIHLLEALKHRMKDGCRLVYSGSENARGVLWGLIVPAPRLLLYGCTTADSVQQLLVSRTSTLMSYCVTKGLAALYFGAYARRRNRQQQQQQSSSSSSLSSSSTSLRVLTVSPGFTVGTAILEQPGAPLQLRLIPNWIKQIGVLLGIAHSVQVGARRYVDAVTGVWDDEFENGAFVASAKLVSGPVCDQAKLKSGEQYGDKMLQDLVYRVLRKYVKGSDDDDDE